MGQALALLEDNGTQFDTEWQFSVDIRVAQYKA